MKHFTFFAALLLLLSYNFYAPNAYSDSTHPAAQRYAEYTALTSTTASLSTLSPYLSKDLLKQRGQYAESFAQKKGKTVAEVETMLLQRAKYSESCIGKRNFLSSRQISANAIIIRHRFKDQCAASSAIAATIEEVTMINEGGMWKVDRVSARPEQPVKIKKVIPLQ